MDDNTIECVYCGAKDTLPYGYSRMGSRSECLQKGIGAGTHTERRKWIDWANSHGFNFPVEPPYVNPCGIFYEQVNANQVLNQNLMNHFGATENQLYDCNFYKGGADPETMYRKCMAIPDEPRYRNYLKKVLANCGYPPEYIATLGSHNVMQLCPLIFQNP